MQISVRACVLVVSTLLLVGPGPSPSVAVPAAEPAGARGTSVDHVIAISVDGLNPRALSRLTARQLPAFTRLARRGTSTRNARTVVERTQTLPNHTSMVTGRRVTGPGGTGVIFNVDPGTTVHESAGEYVPSVFDVVHDRGRRTALLTTKSKFAFLDRSWNGVNGAPDTTGASDGRDKIDVFGVETSPVATTRLLRQLRGGSPPAFSMLHLHDPDTAGHASGWLSRPYLRAVRDADAQVLRVLKTVAGDPQLRTDTVVIVTSDHGGMGTEHSEPTRLANYRVPFLVWGVGVEAGSSLYALNPRDRRDPGQTRPLYSARVQPIRNAEVANLALALLAMPAVPTSQIAPGQSLDVR
jgi:predicted AlkP superfamily pyrophosphatase or phosphodiesterase